MIDLTKYDPRRLSPKDNSLRDWELQIERAANEAQARVNAAEDKRPLVQRLLTDGRKPHP